jgi:hypothetical protein
MPFRRLHGVRVIKTAKFKRCRDGTILNEFYLDELVTMQVLEYFRHYGTVRILANLDPPFYSFTITEYFVAKGMVDDSSVHVRFQRDQVDQARAFFNALISHYPVSWV